jgi:hypothetical protein
MDSSGNVENPHLTCSKCKQSKPASEYRKNSRESRGYAWYCKPCAREWERSRSAERKAERNKNAKAWRVANRERQAFNNQKCNAKKRGISFEFTFDEWVEWWGDEINSRGCGAGQYVMARISDSGPYHPSNVFKCEAGLNVAMGNVK